MSDVTISIDANTSGAEAKARRLKDALDGTGRSWAQAASQTFSRVGGEAGGGLGRLLGGVAGGFSLVGAAAAVAGVGLNAFLGLSDRAVANAQEQVTWQQRLAESIKQTNSARRDLAAGGLSQVAGMRRLLARGGTEEGVKRLEQAGFTREDAVQAAGTLRLGKQATNAEGWAAFLARTGEISLADAAKKIAAVRGPLDSMVVGKFLVEARGERLTPDALQEARADLYRDRRGIDPMSAAVRVSNRVPDFQAAALMSYDTANAVNEQASSTLQSPQERAARVAQEEFDKMVQNLTAAAKNQWKIAAAWKEAGRLVGGEGSEFTKLKRFRENYTAAVNQ